MNKIDIDERLFGTTARSHRDPASGAGREPVPHPGHRPDGPRGPGQPGEMPGGWYGRLPFQAVHARGVGGCAGPLAESKVGLCPMGRVFWRA